MKSFRQSYDQWEARARQHGLLPLIAIMAVGSLLISAISLPPGPDEFVNEAADQGDVAKVKKWIDRDPGLANALDYYNGGTARPIHHAARSGQDQVVALLLNHGVDINIKGRRPTYTPLRWALDEDLRARRDQTSERAAARMIQCPGRRRVIALLLANGAAIDTQHREDSMLMSWALDNHYDDIVQLLAQRGIEPGKIITN